MGLTTIWRAGTPGADDEGLARPVLVHREGVGWDLLYGGLSGGTWRICRATTSTPEPRGFARVGPPLEPGPAGSGEEGGVRSPCAIPTSDGGLLVVYAGRAGAGRWSLFSAWVPSGPGHRASEPPGRAAGAPGRPPGPPPGVAGLPPGPPPGVAGLPVHGEAGAAPGDRPVLVWQRLGPTLPAGEPGDADAAGCDHPTVARLGGRRWLWYAADDGLGAGARIAAASSVPGEGWQRHGVVLGRGAPGQPDEAGAEAPSVVVHRRGGWTPGGGGREQVEMVYTGLSAAGARVLRARSVDGVGFDRLGPVIGPGAREASLAAGPDGRAWLVAVADGEVVAGPASV